MYSRKLWIVIEGVLAAVACATLVVALLQAVGQWEALGLRW